MLPEIHLHRPRGFLPKVSVRERTVLDYQPSWLLLALPALALVLSRRKRSTSSSRQTPERNEVPYPSGTSDDRLSAEAAPRRRRPTVIIVAAVRRRRPARSPNGSASVPR